MLIWNEFIPKKRGVAGDNWWTFECMGESRVNWIFKYYMLGIIEASESAASVIKDLRCSNDRFRQTR